MTVRVLYNVLFVIFCYSCNIIANRRLSPIVMYNFATLYNTSDLLIYSDNTVLYCIIYYNYATGDGKCFNIENYT